MKLPLPLRLLILALLFILLSAQAPIAPNAQSSFDPDLEALLLQNGYSANVINVRGTRGLRASQRNYSSSVWSRDLDYAISDQLWRIDANASDAALAQQCDC